MSEMKLIPKRRFKEFRDDWTVKSLNTILDLLKDGTHGTHRDVEDGIYLLSAKNIKNGRINIDVKDRKISKEEYEKIHRNFKLNSGDILLTVVGSIGEVAIMKKDGEFTFQRSVAYLRPKKEIESDFLYTTVKSNYFQCELKNRQVVSAQPGIYLGDLAEIPIYFPTSKEQELIGKFFKHLDQLITIKQRKLEKLKALESTYLTEMFPAEGKGIPKRRFAGFVDEWEERNFFDNIRRTIDFRGRTPKKLGLDWSDKGYLALSALNVKNGYIDFNTDGHYGNQELYYKWMTGSELKKGQVLFTTEAPMGNVAQVPDSRGYILSQRTISFEVEPEKITDNFLASLLRSNKTFKVLSKLSSGGTAKGVSQRSLRQLKVFVPKTPEEQKVIGEFFKNLDDKITNQQQKLDKLKAMKQAYLQEMFV